MTNKQRQALLAYLGYYVDDIDGIWGTNSKTAATAFRSDYGVEANDKNLLAAINCTISPKKKGDEKTNTGDWWGDIKHFERSEFACKCGRYCNGFPVEPDEQLVKVLENIRKHFGVPVTVNSGIRCKTHNANVGGASASQHLKGTAADIAVKGVTPAKVAAYVETLLPNTGGIGIYSWGVHVDVRKTKSRWNG